MCELTWHERAEEWIEEGKINIKNIVMNSKIIYYFIGFLCIFTKQIV